MLNFAIHHSYLTYASFTFVLPKQINEGLKVIKMCHQTPWGVISKLSMYVPN